MNIKKILLVEDDPQDVELTLTALEEHHLANQVMVVHDGVQALDYLYRRGEFQSRPPGHPVVVLLDLKLPKINGLEVLQIIKADPVLKIVPVVVLSSSRETPDLVECYKNGVNAYVVKPVDFSEFMKAVQQLGIFWAAINESPPCTEPEESDLPGGNTTSPVGGAEATAAGEPTQPDTTPGQAPLPQTAARRGLGKEEVKHEIPAPHPASGG